MDGLFTKLCACLICFLILNGHGCVSASVDHAQKSDIVDYTGSKVIRCTVDTDEQLEYLRSLVKNREIKFWIPPTMVGKHVDIMVSLSHMPELAEKLDEHDIEYEDLIEDVGKKMIKDKIRQFAASDSFFDEFRRNGEIEKFLREKHSENTKLVGLMSIGTSIEHRDIMAVKIGVDHGRANKSIIYIDGGTHAREWAAVSTACYIIDRLIDDYNAGDKVVTYLLNRFDFYVVPVVNPDGYEYSHTTDRMWRKNKAILKGTDCLGTDLNRNYGFHWGGEGSSRDPCEENYSGPKPFSEPESRAVSSLIVDNKHRLMAYITLHSYGQWFLYPWGWTEADSPNKKELKRVADIGHTALNSVYGTTYKLGSPGQIMYVSQGSDDWAHGFAHIPYVYCLEMRDEGQHGFLLPAKDIIPVGNETYAAVKAMAREIALTRRVKSNVSVKIG